MSAPLERKKTLTDNTTDPALRALDDWWGGVHPHLSERDWRTAETQYRSIRAALAAAEAAPLDPYTNLGEHARQSDAGTHSFDPGCKFCLRLYWEDRQEAEAAPLDVERLSAAIHAAHPHGRQLVMSDQEADDALARDIAREYAALAATSETQHCASCGHSDQDHVSDDGSCIAPDCWCAVLAATSRESGSNGK